jgi:tetratricopeptide (TPR) repeat protein
MAIAAAIGEPPPPAQREQLRDIYVDLGTAFARRNRIEEAVVHWRHALELDPECLTALSNIGVGEQKLSQDAMADAEQHRHDVAALSAFEEYVKRAQSLSTPLSEDQVYYRQFFVPNQVVALRKKLGLSTEESEPIEETDRGPVGREAGR